jgi:hypothetical protein
MFFWSWRRFFAFSSISFFEAFQLWFTLHSFNQSQIARYKLYSLANKLFALHVFQSILTINLKLRFFN